MKVELIYDADCPNIAATRARLIAAFAATGLAPRWQEWQRGDEGNPEYARRLGSPTILVEGCDVSAASAMDGSGACRVYADTTGRMSGVPPLEDIQVALHSAERTAVPVQSLKQTLPTVPAVGIALLPKLTCAACWPAYAGLLSALGVGFVDYTPYLLPLTTTFLILTLIMLAYRAGSRRGYAPFALGVVAGAIVLIGKFAFDSDIALYGGITLLVAASLWNAWPIREQGACSACAAPDARFTTPQGKEVS